MYNRIVPQQSFCKNLAASVSEIILRQFQMREVIIIQLNLRQIIRAIHRHTLFAQIKHPIRTKLVKLVHKVLRLYTHILHTIIRTLRLVQFLYLVLSLTVHYFVQRVVPFLLLYMRP